MMHQILSSKIKKFKRLYHDIRNISKLDLVLLITWIWAYISYQITKIAELALIFIMKLPEYAIPQYLAREVRTADNYKVQFKDVQFNGVSKLNKFEWFLNFYFERISDDCPFDENGFDLFKLKKIIDFTTLCINYYKVNNEPPYQECQLVANLGDDMNFYDEHSNLILFGRAALR